MARKAGENQAYADINDSDNFFAAIKAIYGLPTKGTALLLSSDGSALLTEKSCRSPATEEVPGAENPPLHHLRGLDLGGHCQNRPAWRREVKTGAGIYETNRVAAAKAKREARKSQVPRLLIANYPPLLTCPHCQHAFRALIGFIGHLRTQCAINPTTSTSSTTLASTANPSSTATPATIRLP
ncbi:hypothetical protein SprV_0401592300 [Sparganum proliferum]